MPYLPLTHLLQPTDIASPLFYALGYAVGIVAFSWLAKRRGLSTAGVWSVAIIGIFGGLIGANLAQLLVTAGKEGGKTVLGGIIGGYLCVHFYKQRIGLKRPLGDLFAFGLSAGEAIGRWGCFFGGCCYGRETEGRPWWAVYQHEAFRYPTQIYMSLASAGIFGLLLFLEKRRVLPENGLFAVQGFLACLTRFLIEYYRTANPIFIGLTMAQYVSLIGLVFFGIMLHRLMGIRRETRDITA